MQQAPKANVDVPWSPSHHGHHPKKNSVEVKQETRPAVFHELIEEKEHESVTHAVDREIHQHHHQIYVQPVTEKIVEDERHHHRTLPVEHRTRHHGKDRQIASALAHERGQFRNTHQVLPVAVTTSNNTVVGEHVYHHIHNIIQPVIERQRVVPHIVHTTAPIHEHIEHEPFIHRGTVLPAMTLNEFLKRGYSLDGSKQPLEHSLQDRADYGHQAAQEVPVERNHVDYQGSRRSPSLKYKYGTQPPLQHNHVDYQQEQNHVGYEKQQPPLQQNHVDHHGRQQSPVQQGHLNNYEKQPSPLQQNHIGHDGKGQLPVERNDIGYDGKGRLPIDRNHIGYEGKPQPPIIQTPSEYQGKRQSPVERVHVDYQRKQSPSISSNRAAAMTLQVPGGPSGYANSVRGGSLDEPYTDPTPPTAERSYAPSAKSYNARTPEKAYARSTKSEGRRKTTVSSPVSPVASKESRESRTAKSVSSKKERKQEKGKGPEKQNDKNKSLTLKVHKALNIFNPRHGERERTNGGNSPVRT